MSNTQKKNVPELRFPGFEGEWEEKQLGEISEQSMYGIGASATNFDSKNIYIRITDIDEKSRNLNYKNLTTPDEINDKYKLKRNDILFARTGASTGKSYIHKEEKDNYNYYFAGFLIKFEINQLNSPMFIYQFTLTSKFNNWVKVMSVRSGQPGINSEEYAKLPLVLPSKLEQQKIGEFFSKLDRQIELEEQKLELLQQQKKGYMQKIFSQELRFKDENGNDYPDWEEKKMGAITTMFSGGTPQSTNTRYYKGDIPFIRSGEISKTYTELKINEEALNNSSAKLVEVGDLLYALYGATSGEVAISKINGAINQAVLCIRTNESVEFLLNYLFFSKNKILNTFIQGDQGNLSANIIKNLIIETPTIIEQRKIADFFGIIDNLIEIQERKLEFLKQRKQSLLQKMFV
ncbi:TPA: restriction endonuclease subunit S [Staphylococcus aureus]|nr:restriction endonuclease subunit S [Staphylococcus aureus]HDG0794459.1 restriction endonuclease subunit S [Staphylococcus aureus]